MNDTYQLYDDQGRPIDSGYVTKDDIFKQGKLHGAAHVWIWRNQNGVAEVLLQKRSPEKWTWPNCYDVSAAGHINAGEEPLVAGIRETKEEIGIDIVVEHLQCIGVQRYRKVTPNGLIENEFQWVYLLRLDGETTFTIEDQEVSTLVWKPIEDMIAELEHKPDAYVPHGSVYFDTLIDAVKAAA